MKFNQTYKYINPYDYIKKFFSFRWYLEIENELKEFFYNCSQKKNRSREWIGRRKEFIKMVSEFLEANQITLADSGINWDKERLPVDTIVIHHTSMPSNTPMIDINALCLIRLYALEYNRKREKQFGQPIWSNHFFKNQPTFVPYHYMIKNNGSFEHILQDNQIGWHCGNWNYNCRSVAICFYDDLEEKKPTNQAINTARKIMKQYLNCDVFGHREIKPTTTCPGNLFLGENGWKKEFLLKIK